VGLIANHTSYVDSIHLVDFLLSKGVNLKKVFAPEHGFRGVASAGAVVKDDLDERTGLPVISLYGKKKKPTEEDLAGLDVLVFDIQDVGVRFYTYISTMTYCMEAAAEKGLPFVVLDRPNPNGHYVDGPVLKPGFESFVGLHPVPVVHGMTVGEYAMMVNGEKWLARGITCQLSVVPCVGYTHQTPYFLPIPPSPNLPNQQAIYNYPSLCFFEGTSVSVGRGTDFPFQVYGAPWMDNEGFKFVPKSRVGAVSPPHEGLECYGVDLRFQQGLTRFDAIQWKWVFDAYAQNPKGNKFFNSFIKKLVGNDSLELWLTSNLGEGQFVESYQKELKRYHEIRNRYLLYP
jgi:uncharacterized protein YbbC (DUF1343 family)